MSFNLKTARRIIRHPYLYNRSEGSLKKTKSHILICMPFDTIEFQIAQHVFFPYIVENAGLMKVVVYQSFFPTLKNIDLSLFIPILNSDLDEHCLPFGHLTQEVFQHRYGVAVDLSTEPNPTSAYLVYNSNAPVKIGFHAQSTDSIFNLLIKKSDKYIELSYLRIRKLLTDQIQWLYMDEK